MLTAAQNEALTRVEGDAPMARLLRAWTWIPFALPSQIQPGDAPFKVRLLGENYVAWRAPDGRLGFIDERCPHRGVSMALARNEGCVLRCIFHGWAIDVSGAVVEAATHTPDPEAFAARVRVKRYPVREAGGLVWVWLGGEPVQDFPELPFADLPSEHIWMSVTRSPCNWLQGIEATVDSAHVGTMHSSWTAKRSASSDTQVNANAKSQFFLKARSPTYDVARAPWGLTATALRQIDDGSTYVRATQYIAPYIALSPSLANGGVIFIAVPVDDANHLLFFGFFSRRERFGPDAPLLQSIIGNGRLDPHDFAPLRGDWNTNYGQDRQAMAKGHFTGFTDNILVEDVVAQVSMGAIVDRTKEHLSSSDVAVVQTRMLLLRALKTHEDGLAPSAAPYEGVDAMPVDLVVPAQTDWRSALHPTSAVLSLNN
jgi:phthalate 4,5-dioxygenase